MAPRVRFLRGFIRAIAGLAIGILAACEFFGGSSETGNTLSGVILEDDSPPSKVAASRRMAGAGKANVRVELYPEGWDPVFRTGNQEDRRTALTDKAGRYVFRNVAPGNYNIEATAPDSSGMALIAEVRMPEGTGQTIAPESAFLKPSGGIRVSLPELKASDGYFFLPGTGASGVIDSAARASGMVTVKPVASGTYPSILWGTLGRTVTEILVNPVFVGPGEERLIGPGEGGWMKMRKITLNTSPTGVEIRENLVAFPLLIRLDSSNFDFTEADAGGKSIRFTKADARTTLPFEVEKWDVETRCGDVWVLMDTVHPGRADQSIYLFSGKTGTAIPVVYDAVFDTGAGFAGVWHLGGNLLDATWNRNHGVDSGTEEMGGMIGDARYFNGDSAFIRIPNHSSLNFGTGDFTLSAWFGLDNVTDEIRQILTKHNLVKSGYEIQNAAGVADMIMGSAGKPSTIKGSTLLKDGQWYHVAVTRKDGWVNLYLDGNADADSLYKPFDVDGDADLLFGSDAFLPDEFFLGALDEIRILRVSRSPDWIRFESETAWRNSAKVGPAEDAMRWSGLRPRDGVRTGGWR